MSNRPPGHFSWDRNADPNPLDSFLIPPQFELEVRKMAGYVMISQELLWDIEGTGPAPPPPSRRTRLRWWCCAARERLARLAYRMVAGHDPHDGDDDW